jgi:hypothetical protein
MELAQRKGGVHNTSNTDRRRRLKEAGLAANSQELLTLATTLNSSYLAFCYATSPVHVDGCDDVADLVLAHVLAHFFSYGVQALLRDVAILIGEV